MNEEQIKTLLQRADEAAGEPQFRSVNGSAIRRQVHRRHLLRVAGPLAAAAVVLLGVALWAVCTRLGRPQPQPPQVALLAEQVKQLQAQTDATLRLVQEVLEKDKQQRHLAALEAEVARIPDPQREMDRQVDKSVFILVYQADQLYKQLHETDSAVQAYQDIIRLFPTNRWAALARQRLAEIEQRHNNRSEGQKGAAPWEPRNT